MKSGPTLKGWTLYFVLKDAISPIATVVFPVPLPVPAMRMDGVFLMEYHLLDNGFKGNKFHWLLLITCHDKNMHILIFEFDKKFDSI